MGDEITQKVEEKSKLTSKGIAIGIAIVILLLSSALGGAIADRLFVIKPLDYFVKRAENSATGGALQQRVLNEESVVIEVADRVSPSVVTVAIVEPQRRILEFNPFGGGFQSRIEGGEPQDIGSGFIVSSDGLVITNKHVVSDTGAEYEVITKDGKEYKVQTVSRDPSNDLAVLKIDPAGGNLTPVELGDSGNLGSLLLPLELLWENLDIQ